MTNIHIEYTHLQSGWDFAVAWLVFTGCLELKAWGCPWLLCLCFSWLHCFSFAFCTIRMQAPGKRSNTRWPTLGQYRLWFWKTGNGWVLSESEYFLHIKRTKTATYCTCTSFFGLGNARRVGNQKTHQSERLTLSQLWHGDPRPFSIWLLAGRQSGPGQRLLSLLFLLQFMWLALVISYSTAWSLIK